MIKYLHVLLQRNDEVPGVNVLYIIYALLLLHIMYFPAVIILLLFEVIINLKLNQRIEGMKEKE
jgi:hypothetical protein